MVEGLINEKTDASSPVALITGASSGFGMLTAVELARKGYTVAATMRDRDKAGDLTALAEQNGVSGLIHPMQLDVTDEDGIKRTLEEAMKRFGPIDVLVNNAGFAVGGYIEELTMEDWRRQLDTNFFGLVAMTKAVLPSMRERRYGCIINVSSVSGLAGFPGYGPYAASKFAVEGFSESLRHEMAPFGVRIVLVEPGAFRTPIWNKGLGQIARPDGSPYRERLEAVLRYSKLASEKAPDPREVAVLIAGIAGKKAPRLRYPVGKDAGMLLWWKALLPWKWLEGIIARALK